MAMSMSIVNLDRTIRTHFDQRIGRIQRNMQVEYGNRANQNTEDDNSSANNQSSETNDVSTTETNQVLDTTRDNSVQSASQGINQNEASDSNIEPNNCNANTARPARTVPRPRTESMSIEVEYGELAVTRPAASDTRSDTSDALDREIRTLSDSGERNYSCCDFYRKHWVGNLITGIFSGFLFILLGVIFLVNGEQFPTYAGIMLIVLGLAPCCMAINRYRYARLYEQERRRALVRLNAMRRAHRRHRREERRRQMFSDLPPSYDNLGFELPDDLDLDNFSIATSNGSLVLPTYEQFVTKNKEKMDKKSKRISEDLKENDQSMETELPPPSYDTNSNNNDINNNNGANVQTDNREFVQISMTADHIEIVEVEPSRRQSEHSNSREPEESVSSPSGFRDTHTGGNDHAAPCHGADNLGYISDSTGSASENIVEDAHNQIE